MGRTLVFVRCHTLPEFVADTIDALRHYATDEVQIACTVDRCPEIEERLAPRYPDVLFFHSTLGPGNGYGGLWKLFSESVAKVFDRGLTFDRLWNFDYDLIPVTHGWDRFFLDRFHPGVGLVGRNSPDSHVHVWNASERLQPVKDEFAAFGLTYPGGGWKDGTHVSGACGGFTYDCLKAMRDAGVLGAPFTDMPIRHKLPDDVFSALVVKTLGFDFQEIGYEAYIRMEAEAWWRELPDRGIVLYHPTKITPGWKPYSVAVELECRNYFRARRGAPPMPNDTSMPDTIRPESLL